MSGLGDEDEERMSAGEGDESDGEGDDEEFTGFGEGAGGSGSAPRGGKPKKAPTGSEVRAIKDAAELFRSSSFKLQVTMFQVQYAMHYLYLL